MNVWDTSMSVQLTAVSAEQLDKRTTALVSVGMSCSGISWLLGTREKTCKPMIHPTFVSDALYK